MSETPLPRTVPLRDLNLSVPSIIKTYARRLCDDHPNLRDDIIEERDVLLAWWAAARSTDGLREALGWLRGSEDSIGRFMRDPIGSVVRLDDVLALLELAHVWPPDGQGVCADCGFPWPCSPAVEAGSARRAALAEQELR